MSSVQDQIAELHLQPVAFIAVAAVFVTLAIIAVALRVYVRAYMLRAWGLDDTLLVLAAIIYAADCSIFMRIGVVQLHQGVSAEAVAQQLMLILAVDLLYISTHLFLKASLALFVMRIIFSRWQVWVVRISLGVYLAVGVAFFFLGLFICGVPSISNFITGDHCLTWDGSWGPMTYLFSILNALMDWILTITPVLYVWKLHIPPREKALACLLILLGMLGSIVSVVRIPYVSGLRPASGYKFFTNFIPICLCSVVESGIGIIALALAACRPLWRQVIGGSRARTTLATHRTLPHQTNTRTIPKIEITQDFDTLQEFKRQSIGSTLLVTNVV
ncbi:hypothetical protein MBLNU457_1769t1 [Dothideomycetes sp. NU457]